MLKHRIAITAGGTGGHLFPACSLAHQLTAKGHSILFLGGKISTNPFFEKGELSHREISCSRLKSPLFPFRTAKGISESIQALKEYKPSILVGFGSYYTLPVLSAAKWLGIPYVLHEQNSVPGKVNRLFSGGAEWSAIHFPIAKGKLRSPVLEVEMPLRPGFDQLPDKKEARAFYGLSQERPVILVFGGSQGARAINSLLHQSAPLMQSWQVLHFTGNSEWTRILEAGYRANSVQAFVKDFEGNMARAWRAADLVVSRSGAASIAEQISCEVPGLLIPYPHATDQHQNFNADFMVDNVQGAVKCSEKELNPTHFINQLVEVIPQLPVMKQSIQEFKQKRKLLTLCQAIETHLII